MLKVFHCDLHIHTCLSPCADLDIFPSALVEEAVQKGLDLIAICDHNSSDNTGYVISAARGRPVRVLPGMEVTSSEEVHVLALFEKLEQLQELQQQVDRSLVGRNEENIFGPQVIVNEFDEVEGYNERLLIGATQMSVREIVTGIHELGGLAIASHIDRESFNIVSQLGFIPPDLKFDAAEISSRMGIWKGRQEFAELYRIPFITTSDAHFLHDIGAGKTAICMAEPTFSELKQALRKQGGRFVLED